MSDHQQHHRQEEKVLTANAKSVAGNPLPPIPPEHANSGTILLFYQYKEPIWTSKQHKQVLKDVIALGQKHNITGRGRVAPEGLNCTLSGWPQDIRNFCYGLRNYDNLFSHTDFKLTDGIPVCQLFKSLSIRKTKELVAYGLAGNEKAPSLTKFAGEHLEAVDYHKAMQDTNTVIVDVRNAYESAIGNFAPPPGGAELIDPQMRNSIEFPKWLNDERTQKKLHGKKVLMYCTGGIRCERATALVNQISSVNPNFQPKAVYELQGGIERYLKTYPEGGYWKGKNYLFDRRMEQVPDAKPRKDIENDINSKCAVCRCKYTIYRGKFKCSQGLCGVPVIVCDDCKVSATSNPKQLLCELCIVGYKAPQLMPDLVGLKRKAETKTEIGKEEEDGTAQPNSKSQKTDGGMNGGDNENDDEPTGSNESKNRLFLSKVPLTATKTKLAELLGEITILHWIVDKKTGGFYGSCIVELKSESDAEKAVNAIPSLKLDKKKIKITHLNCRNNNNNGQKQQQNQQKVWPPPNLCDREYPPIGS